MTDPQIRYRSYAPDTRCAVPECDHPAEYEVYLYDFYERHTPGDQEFYEQDYTCPFICGKHMDENERLAVGERVPRGEVVYPYTNGDQAQGYTKYAPVEHLFPLLVDASAALRSGRLVQTFDQVNEELIRHLGRHPELLREISPRKFEELVAAIFRDLGFRVELTPQTRDGGRDVHALRSDAIGDALYLIECKRYAADRKVGVEAVRGLYGVTKSERATRGIIVTTSTFTRDAIEFASPLRYELSLRDFDALRESLGRFRSGQAQQH